MDYYKSTASRHEFGQQHFKSAHAYSMYPATNYKRGGADEDLNKKRRNEKITLVSFFEANRRHADTAALKNSISNNYIISLTD